MSPARTNPLPVQPQALHAQPRAAPVAPGSSRTCQRSRAPQIVDHRAFRSRSPVRVWATTRVSAPGAEQLDPPAGVARGPVLGVVLRPRPPHLHDLLRSHVVRLAALVHELDGRHVHRGQPELGDAPAQVGVLAVHEELLVEPPEGLEQRAPDEEERARDEVHDAIATAVPSRHLLAIERRTPTEDRRQSRRDARGGEERRSPEAAEPVCGPVLVERSTPHDAHPRMIPQEGRPAIDRPRSHLGVGIQEQEKLPTRLRGATVARPAEADVAGQLDHPVGAGRPRRLRPIHCANRCRRR